MNMEKNMKDFFVANMQAIKDNIIQEMRATNVQQQESFAKNYFLVEESSDPRNIVTNRWDAEKLITGIIESNLNWNGFSNFSNELKKFETFVSIRYLFF